MSTSWSNSRGFPCRIFGLFVADAAALQLKCSFSFVNECVVFVAVHRYSTIRHFFQGRWSFTHRVSLLEWIESEESFAIYILNHKNVISIEVLKYSNAKRSQVTKIYLKASPIQASVHLLAKRSRVTK